MSPGCAQECVHTRRNLVRVLIMIYIKQITAVGTGCLRRPRRSLPFLPTNSFGRVTDRSGLETNRVRGCVAAPYLTPRPCVYNEGFCYLFEVISNQTTVLLVMFLRWQTRSNICTESRRNIHKKEHVKLKTHTKNTHENARKTLLFVVPQVHIYFPAALCIPTDNGARTREPKRTTAATKRIVGISDFPGGRNENAVDHGSASTRPSNKKVCVDGHRNVNPYENAMRSTHPCCLGRARSEKVLP